MKLRKELRWKFKVACIFNAHRLKKIAHAANIFLHGIGKAIFVILCKVIFSAGTILYVPSRYYDGKSYCTQNKINVSLLIVYAAIKEEISYRPPQIYAT